MNRPRSRDSAPLATPYVEIEEQELRWTTISRSDFFPSARCNARSGVAIARARDRMWRRTLPLDAIQRILEFAESSCAFRARSRHGVRASSARRPQAPPPRYHQGKARSEVGTEGRTWRGFAAYA